MRPCAERQEIISPGTTASTLSSLEVRVQELPSKDSEKVPDNPTHNTFPREIARRNRIAI
jgi:hypothetical protein